MKRAQQLVVLVLVGLMMAGVVRGDDGHEWPEACACPSYVKLDRSKMKDVDGREDEMLRRRPWPNEKNKMEHSELEISNLKMHHFLNEKAIMINSGSPDKPKVNGQVGSYTKIVLKNLDIGQIQRTQSGLHLDHIWIGPGHDEAFRPDVLLEDVFLHGGNAGVMPILFEQGGDWGTLTLRRVAVAECKHPVMIKLKNSSFKEIIIEECPGLRVVMQGKGEPVVVKVRKSPGIFIGLPKDNEGEEAQVEVVYE